MKTFFLISSFVLGFFVLAQAQNSDLNMNMSAVFFRVDGPEGGGATYDDIKGTPYPSENFVEATLKEGGDKVYMVRYDAYRGLLQFKDDKGEIQALNPDKPYHLDIVGTTKAYITLPYPDKQRGFGMLLWENSAKVRLIKRQVVKYNKGQESDGYKAATSASFTPLRETYFIQLANGEVKEVPTQKKRIFEEFFDKSLEKKAKKQKLNPKEEADLIALMGLHFGK